MLRGNIHTIMDGLQKWHEGWTNLHTLDDLLGAPLGTIATLFLENELADVEGRPLDGKTMQDAVNVLIFYLAMRQSAYVSGKHKAIRGTT